jgi:hypothetical protein
LVGLGKQRLTFRMLTRAARRMLYVFFVERVALYLLKTIWLNRTISSILTLSINQNAGVEGGNNFRFLYVTP